jgi:hypothetical protein
MSGKDANAMSEQELAAELARLRDYLVALESGAAVDEQGPGAPPAHNEREIARVRGRIAELEADLGL